MLRFEGKNHMGENKKAVLGSGVVAKATLCRLDGQPRQAGGFQYNIRYTVIVVFRMSTRLEFYWVFGASSINSSRRSWKQIGYFERDNQPYKDFGSFVRHYANLHGLSILFERRLHKKLLSNLLVTTTHDSILANWEPQSPRSIVTDRCRRSLQRARSGRLAW